MIKTGTECGHKAHAGYREALESLWLHAWLAHQDLGRALDEARVRGEDPTTATTRGFELHLIDHKIVDVEERLAHGRQLVVDARAVVDRHMASKRCKLVPA